MSDICGYTEDRSSGTWICTAEKGHGPVIPGPLLDQGPMRAPQTRPSHYFEKKRTAICPECVAGKHRNCCGDALDEQTDQIVECFCANNFHPKEA